MYKRQGFKGRIITTYATADLCNIMLIDSAHIQEMESEWKNRKARRAGRSEVEPLYTMDDAVGVLKLLDVYKRQATFTIGIILVLITLFIVLNLMNSRSGRAIMAIRDNRIAAESVGINITKYKLMAFSISASMAGVAGVLYACLLYTS